MSQPIGTFVESGECRKPDTLTDSGRSKSDESSNAGNPSIIAGYENAVEPDTIRIGGSGGGGSDSTRRTKSGKIDGRTRAGRNTGYSGAGENASISSDLNSKISLIELLFSLHQMGSAFFSVAELELDKTEAEKLGTAIKEVSKYYAVVIDPKKVAIANLMVVAGGIYGTRFVAYRTRKKMERGKEKLVEMPARTERVPVPATPPMSSAKGAKSAEVQRSPSELWPESGVITGDVW